MTTEADSLERVKKKADRAHDASGYITGIHDARRVIIAHARELDADTFAEIVAELGRLSDAKYASVADLIPQPEDEGEIAERLNEDANGLG